MNYRSFCVYDFETTSKFSNSTQPVQLAGVMVHGRKLEIIPNSEFCSLIKPISDPEECARLGLDPLEDGAVAIHGKTAAMLEDAPSLKTVWSNFVEYVNEHNFRKNSWSAPISVGYNIRNFDSIIVDRICTKEPWGYGPKDEKFKCQGLFHPIHSIDLLDSMFMMMENNKEVNSLSADNLIRGVFGHVDTVGGAHDALGDVIMTAQLFCKVMRLMRKTASKIEFKGCMANEEDFPLKSFR